jgi:hypothetical protein
MEVWIDTVWPQARLEEGYAWNEAIGLSEDKNAMAAVAVTPAGAGPASVAAWVAQSVVWVADPAVAAPVEPVAWADCSAVSAAAAAAHGDRAVPDT